MANVIGRAKELLEAVKTWTEGKFVTKVSGKGLSTNDFTNALKTKLDSVASGAQVNVIETVKVNGTALTPVSKAVDITIDTTDRIAVAEKGVANGVATLGSDGKVPAGQLPSYVDDVLEYASLSSFPSSGETGKIYVAKDTNKTYRWGGTSYVVISETIAVGTTAGTAFDGKAGNDHVTNTTVHVTSANKTAWNAKYDKPSGGIPKSDLASAVQTSLGLADTSVQPSQLGTAAAKNVPASGNASSTEVVMGNDSRLTDTRTPKAHTHVCSDITDLEFMTTTEMASILNGTV